MISGFTVFALLIWLWFIPYQVIEYNLAVNLFTSSIFMVFTIVFLSWLLNLRERIEWKTVEATVNSMIAIESGILFGEVMRLLENGLPFLLTISVAVIEDPKKSKKLVFSELSRLQEKETVKLFQPTVLEFLKTKEVSEGFQEARRNLSEIQAKYTRHLHPKLTLSLMAIQDSINLVCSTYEANNAIKYLQKSMSPSLYNVPSNHPFFKELDNLSPEQFIPDLLRLSLWSLLKELYNLWQLGIQFDHA